MHKNTTIFNPSRKAHNLMSKTTVPDLSANLKINENKGDYDPWVDYIPSEIMPLPEKKSNKNEKILRKIIQSGINKENVPPHHNLMSPPHISEPPAKDSKRNQVNLQSVEFDFEGDFDEFPEKKLEDTSPNIFFEISPQTMIINGDAPFPKSKNMIKTPQCNLLQNRTPKNRLENNKSFEKRRNSTNNCSKYNEKPFQTNNYMSPNDMGQCTFTPKTTAKNQEKRSLNEFLESQAKFKEKQAKTIEKIKLRLEMSYYENHTFHPEISNKSKKMVMSKSSNNLQNNNTNNDKSRENDNSSSQITQTKPNKINSLSKNTSRLLEQQFQKAFERALNELGVTDRLDFDQLFQLLVTIGTLIQSPSKQEANLKITAEVWSILKGDLNQGIIQASLYIFLLTVLRLPMQKRPLSNSKISNNSSNESLWEPTSTEEVNVLQRKFEIFYLNKLSNDRQRKPSKTPENKRNHPSISPISQMLALHHREKLLNEVLYLVHNNEEIEGLEFKPSENKILNNVDLMVLQRKIQKLHHQYLQEENDKKVTEKCTFNPEINSSKTPKNRSRMNSFSNNRPLMMKNKKDKDPLEIEFERAKKECTFKPEIKKKVKPTLNKGLPVKNEKKTVERMRNARLEKEFIDTCRQRGMHSSHLTREKQQNFELTTTSTVSPKNVNEEGIMAMETTRKEEEKVPLLFVDVNLGTNKNERIVIYDGDRSDLLAKEFCKTHGLDNSTEFKLKNLLDEQISGVLTKIPEYPISEEENILDFYNN